MADLHYREKLKKIEQAALSSDEIPEQVKTFGMGCFHIGVILVIGFLIFLAISLFLNDIIIGSIITLVVACAFIYILIKLWTAPRLP